MNLKQSLINEDTQPIRSGVRWETTVPELADGVGRLLVKRGYRTQRMTLLVDQPFTHIIESECGIRALRKAIKEYIAALVAVSGSEVSPDWIKQAHAKLQEAG